MVWVCAATKIAAVFTEQPLEKSKRKPAGKGLAHFKV